MRAWQIILYQLSGKKAETGVREKKTDHGRRAYRRCRNQFRFQRGGRRRTETCGRIFGGDYDEVYIVYSEFVSIARQVATIKQLLPIPPIISEDEAEEESGLLGRTYL